MSGDIGMLFDIDVEDFDTVLRIKSRSAESFCGCVDLVNARTRTSC